MTPTAYRRRLDPSHDYWLRQSRYRRVLLRLALDAGTPQRLAVARQDAKALLRRYAAERAARRFS